MARTQEVTTEKLMADLRVVVRDAEELIKATAGVAGDKVAAVREQAEISLKAAKERLSAMGNGAYVHARHAAEATDEYVRTNPWQSVGIGAAIGLLVGFLASRR
jgi:ElaB/YqjD/DUF883 family membrane-anchored ribosome-binding protein